MESQNPQANIANKTKLRDFVYAVFSERNMLILAILAIPTVIALLLNVSGGLLLFISALDWLIWLAFLLEFVLKVYVEDDKTAYIKANQLDSAISAIIIVSPVFSLLLSKTVPLPVFGVVRATIRIMRTLVYGNKAVLKNQTKEQAGYVQRPAEDKFDKFKPLE